MDEQELKRIEEETTRSGKWLDGTKTAITIFQLIAEVRRLRAENERLKSERSIKLTHVGDNFPSTLTEEDI